MELTREFIILFEWLYPGHQLLLNVDWSSNHDAIAADVLTLSNLLVRWDGGKKTQVSSKVIEPGCANPEAIPEPWWERMQVGQMEHFVFQPGDPPPFYDLAAKPVDYEGKAIGLKELLYRRG